MGGRAVDSPRRPPRPRQKVTNWPGPAAMLASGQLSCLGALRSEVPPPSSWAPPGSAFLSPSRRAEAPHRPQHARALSYPLPAALKAVRTHMGPRQGVLTLAGSSELGASGWGWE